MGSLLLIALCLVLAIAVVLVWARRDYRAWRALGPGGLPESWEGWWQMTRWRVHSRDPFALAPLSARAGDADDIATLADLVPRTGGRPCVGKHPVPHRQLTDHAPEEVKLVLTRTFDTRVADDPVHLSYARSHFEKRVDAVTLLPACCRHADAVAAHGEIGHIHPSDGSMHMVLSASDARIVVERGWGERHGLAGVMLGLPLGYTLIYAPRDEQEVAIDGRILDAAIAYMRGAASTNDLGSQTFGSPPSI